MPYIVKRETTGRVGRYHYDHRIIDYKTYETWDEAVAKLTSIRQALSKPKYGAIIHGPEHNYYVAMNNEHYDCIERYYIESIYENDAEVTFTINKVENRRIAEFCAKHKEHSHSGSAGEYVRVFFTPTGLGDIVEVQCLTCGAVENVTDFDSW